MWFTEHDANKISRITLDGAIMEAPVPTPASSPHGIVAGPHRTLWFTEYDGNRIGVLVRR